MLFRSHRIRPGTATAIATENRTPASTFFFKITATTETYTLSLHDGSSDLNVLVFDVAYLSDGRHTLHPHAANFARSEEHTSELQSQSNLVCRLLLEKKKRCAASAWRARWRASC